MPKSVKRKAIHKDKITKFVLVEDLDLYLASGWILGKGYEPWNKGKTVVQEPWNKGKHLSNEQKQKLSEAHKGYKWTKEQIAKRTASRKANGWNKHPEETHKKLSNSLLNHPVSEETRLKISLKNKGKPGYPLSEEAKKKISLHNSSLEFQMYSIAKKIKNGTINTSKLEEYCYEKLLAKYGTENIFRNYHDKRYPFACDFYIKNLDIFIEINNHWTHGPHKFDSTNPEDLLLLNKWKAKQKMYLSSKGKLKQNSYFIAEKVWTIKDPLKFKIAKEHKLNYYVFYTKETFNNWISLV